MASRTERQAEPSTAKGKKKKESAKPVRKRADAGPDEQGLGAGLGVLAGGAVGAIGGPIGMALGASIGAVVGEAAGEAVHEHAVAAAKHERDVETLLRADHDKLEKLAATILESIVAGDRSEVGGTMEVMQSAVTAHLAEEERELLPAYAEHAPQDAQAILDDHAAIRAALAEFDMETDLHLLRADAVKAFLERLRAHAARENAGLYRWAETREARET
jgi:outer membrane lipoprotein SlyB